MLFETGIVRPSGKGPILARKVISVSEEAARSTLERLWRNPPDVTRLPPQIDRKVRGIIGGNTLTYRYILVTGLLAKIVQPKVNARALQSGSKLSGAYDARSLCHHAVVPFEQQRGNLWGQSNEPFVSKVARHPEIDRDNPQLRDKAGAKLTHDVLEWANDAPSDLVEAAATLTLLLGKARLGSVPPVTPRAGVRPRQVMEYSMEFLVESDGGARLVGVAATLLRLMNPAYTVRVYPPNMPDKFAEKAGDIELRDNDSIDTAYECKDRLLSENDITHGIGKAVARGVRQYIFLTGVGIPQPEVDPSKLGGSKGIHSCWIGIEQLLRAWTILLNSRGLDAFGETLVGIMSEMRRLESAKKASELWNALIAGPESSR